MSLKPAWWIAVVWAAMVATLFGWAIWNAADSAADPGVSPQVAVYAAKSAPAVCSTLADFPTLDGVAGVAEGITEDGFTGYEAGQIIALAVEAKCPNFVPLLTQFANEYAPTGVQA